MDTGCELSDSKKVKTEGHGLNGGHVIDLKAERQRRALEEEFNSRPRVRHHKQCVQWLQGHNDFLTISETGIELAARHVAECLGKPDAVLSSAYWAGNTLWIKFWERQRGRKIEGLFKGLPAYEDDSIVTKEFHMGDVDFDPPGQPDETLEALGYTPAWAYEVEALLDENGKAPREAMQHGLIRAIEWAVDEVESEQRMGRREEF